MAGKAGSPPEAATLEVQVEVRLHATFMERIADSFTRIRKSQLIAWGNRRARLVSPRILISYGRLEVPIAAPERDRGLVCEPSLGRLLGPLRFADPSA